MLDLYLAESRILFFREVLESIQKPIIELHVLQCLFVRGSNEKQRKVGLFQILQKERFFHLLWKPSALVGNFTRWPPSCTLQRKSSSTFSVWSIERRAYQKIARMFPIPTNRNRMINTLIIINISLTCKR